MMELYIFEQSKYPLLGCDMSMMIRKMYGYKVDMSKLKIAIIWTPIFEWFVVRCGSKNGH